MIYIGGFFIQYQSSEGCLIDILGGLSIDIHRRVVHKKKKKLIIGVCPLFISEGCPQLKTNTFVWKWLSFMEKKNTCLRESEGTRGV